MVSIRVRLFSIFREIAGTGTVDLEFEEEPTVDRVVRTLADSYGGRFRELTIDESGRVSRSLRFLVNDSELPSTGLDTKLKEGDLLAILVPVAGG